MTPSESLVDTHSIATGKADLQAVWELNVAYLSRGAILTAAELGLFTLLAAGPATCAQVCERMRLEDRGTRNFLDALVALGMLDRVDDHYRSTALAASYFDATRPTYLGDFLRVTGARWDLLAAALRTGAPQTGASRDTEDRALFVKQHRSAAQWRSFLNGMDYLSSVVAPHVAASFDWSDVVDVADLGGARGNLAAHLLDEHPHLELQVFDLPPVRTLFVENMARLCLTGHVRFVAGDFFTDPLPSVDVMLMTHVLHNWSEPQRRLLVARAMAAVRPGGAVLICDPMIDSDGSGNVASLLASLTMTIATTGGGEYSADECRSYLVDAGADRVTVPERSGHETVVIGWKDR